MSSEIRIHKSTRLVTYICYVLNTKRNTAKRNKNCIYVLKRETEVRRKIEIGSVIFTANLYRRFNTLVRKDKRKRECGEPR